MHNPFRKPPVPARSAHALAHAEHALIAEALLRASAHLIGRPEPVEVAQQFCDSLIEATPNITLAWVFYGDLGAEVVQPQVVSGPAAPRGSLQISRGFFATPGADPGAVITASRTHSFDVSPASFHAPWRAAATSFGARSILLVPIAEHGDERGWLAVYAAQPKFFETVSIGLFDTLGQLLHTALVHSRNRVDRAPEEATDSVTGLATRLHVKHQLEQAWRLPPEHDTRGLLLIADLDHFRAINDSYGRIVGNLALRQVAQSLLGNVRKTDLVARWGGNQFLVWLPNVSASVAGATAEKLRVAIAELPVPSDQAGGALMAVSIGATPVTENDSFTTAHDRADRALHRAKQVSRGCVVVARPGA